MPGYIARAMAVPLFKHQGYTNTDIATVTKVFGFWIALGGTFMDGWLIPRIGMMSSLLIRTVAGSASHLALALLAAHGGDGGKAFWTFALAVGIEGFAYAFASVVLITYMSTLRFSGTRGKPVRPADLPLRLSGQHFGWIFGLSRSSVRDSSGSSSGPPSSASQSRCWRSLYGTALGSRMRRRYRRLLKHCPPFARNLARPGRSTRAAHESRLGRGSTDP